MDDILGDGRVEIRDGGPVAYYFLPLCWACAAALRPVVQQWLAARAASRGGRREAQGGSQDEERAP